MDQTAEALPPPDRGDGRDRSRLNLRAESKIDGEWAGGSARRSAAEPATATANTGDGNVEMARLCKLAKASATTSRTQAINQLKAVLISTTPTLRASLSGLSTPSSSPAAPNSTPGCPPIPPAPQPGPYELLARRIAHLTTDIRDLQARLASVVAATTPKLLACNGVGPDSAAALLITAGDNPDRLGSQASFAALCATSPVEAASGKTHRHRPEGID